MDESCDPQDRFALEPTYVDNGDGTVSSSCCGLTWQQGIGPTLYVWEDAVAYCVGLELAGGGWRLPKIEELHTLLDRHMNPLHPTIDQTAFPDTPAEDFWSSSEYTATTGESLGAFFTNFYSDHSSSGILQRPAHARCVR
jgi:hypothetical protein